MPTARAHRGLTANFNLICYYAAPLSTVYAVISTRYDLG